MSNARGLADDLAALLAREHDAMAEFLVALAEFARKRAWAELGYSSLFWFLHRRLGLSKSAAHSRKVAADLVQGHPGVLAALRDGRLCLTSIVELAKVLTAENRAEILPRFFHLSRREAAEVAAAIRPVARPPMRGIVTVVSPSPTLPPPAATSVATIRDIPVAVLPAEPLLRVTSPPPILTVPLTEELRRLHVTVSKPLLVKVDAARDALSHSHPGATVETILEAGLDLLLERHRKRRGVGAKARTSGPKAGTGRISAAARREVWERDGGRCQWPLEGGGICGSTLRLEYDHVVPRGKGGSSGPANLRLLCRVHNQFTARRAYGDAHMDRFAVRIPRASEPVAPWRCDAAGSTGPPHGAAA